MKQVLVAGLALALSACATLEPARPVDGVVTAVRDGRTRLHVGETLSISLPSNPSTGFAWSLKPYDEAILAPASPFNEVVPGAREGGAVGVPGQTVWRFDARTTGDVVLTFEYRQAWSDAPPAETARFPVGVR